jgi:hypothetical protein
MTGEFTGNKIAAFPYILASKEDQIIYSAECVPGGFSLSDPDHLPAFKIETLYTHWLTRQSKKLPPFIVLNPGPLHISAKKSEKVKGKKKMEYEEVSTDDDEEEVQDSPDGDGGEIGFPLAAKYGPPVGRPKISMAADAEASSSVLLKTTSKEANGKDADGRAPEGRKTRTSSKRKRGDEEAENPPQKRSKHDDRKKTGRKTGNSADDGKAIVGDGKKRKRNVDDREKTANQNLSQEASAPNKNRQNQ